MPRERSLDNHFSGLSLDRAEAVRLEPEAVRRAWSDAQVLVVDFEGHALGNAHGPRPLRGADLGEARRDSASFLGINPGEPGWFTLPASELVPGELAEPLEWIGLRQAASHWDRLHNGIFAYAKALLLWQSRARFCGACGSATQLVRAGHCARCRNPQCALQHFPRTDAAIIVLVHDGPRALLGRQRSWPERRWSTLAGFVEPGESLEDAVRREVGEEAGVQLAEVNYHSSQPWPFPGALMVGFHAACAKATITVGEELEDARWFDAHALFEAIRHGEVDLPPAFSISRRLILDWLATRIDPTQLHDWYD